MGRARAVAAFPEVVGDSAAAVRKDMDGVEFVIVDGDDWQRLRVLHVP